MESLVLRAVLAECRSLMGRSVAGIEGQASVPRWTLNFRPRGALVIDLAGTAPALYGSGLGPEGEADGTRGVKANHTAG